MPPGTIGEDGRVQAPKRNKFNARKTTVDGITFDSAKEAKRWTELKMLQAAGQIEHLHRQVPYSILVNGEKICSYVADFYYVERESGDRVVEDCKGFRTREYLLKKKLMQAVHSITIREV